MEKSGIRAQSTKTSQVKEIAWPIHNFTPRDIVVDLFRMAEIEQNEDLVTACVTDIRFQNMRDCHWFLTPRILTSYGKSHVFCAFFGTFRLITHSKSDRKAVDSDGDGEITKDEFVTHALKSRFLQKMLEN